MTDIALPPKSAPASPVHPGRLKLLLLAHLLASLAPAVALLAPATMSSLLVIWLGSSIWISQLMLVALWLGMGGGRLATRVVVAILSCAFLAIWPSARDFGREDVLYHYLTNFSLGLVGCAVWSAIFLAIRTFKLELRCTPTLPGLQASSASQFSIRQILFVTLFVAIVLSLSLVAHAESRPGDSQWASLVLLIVTFSANLLCAVWATLSAARVRWRLSLVLLASLFLNIIANWPSNIQVLGWRRFVEFVVATTAPTLIVAASLLVVRSCGYRLLPKRGDLPAQQGT